MPNVPFRRAPHRAFGCFSLLILNDWAAPSYQLLDLSLAGLRLDMLFLIADLLSFEVGILVLSLLGNCLPLNNQRHRTSHPIASPARDAPSRSVMLKVPPWPKAPRVLSRWLDQDMLIHTQLLAAKTYNSSDRRWSRRSSQNVQEFIGHWAPEKDVVVRYAL